MKTHVTGQLLFGEPRHALAAIVCGNLLLLTQEQLLANYHSHECEDAGQFTRWLTSAQPVFANCQPAGPPPTILLTGYAV